MNQKNDLDNLFEEYGSRIMSVQEAIENLALAFLYAGKVCPIAIVLTKDSLEYYSETLKPSEPNLTGKAQVQSVATAAGRINIIDESNFITRGSVQALDLRDKVLFLHSDDIWADKMESLRDTVTDAGGICFIGLPLSEQVEAAQIDQAIKMLEAKKTPCGAV